MAMARTDKRMTFETWMRAVDAAVESKAGVSVHDLPDCCFRDWYDAGTTATTAAKWALRAAGF